MSGCELFIEGCRSNETTQRSECIYSCIFFLYSLLSISMFNVQPQNIIGNIMIIKTLINAEKTTSKTHRLAMKAYFRSKSIAL